MAPQLIFGSASFGMDLTEFQDVTSVKALLQILSDLGVHRLDSAARYPPLNPGRSEMLIGEAKEFSKHFTIDTKIYTDTQTNGSGDLTREAIQNSVKGSLQRLQIKEGVNVLYSHRSDPSTPLEEQIRGFNEQIAQGHCKSWGVSNTPPAVLEQILQLCEVHGWEKPSCYQGSYNLITRGMETKLLSLLREHGMVFNGFQCNYLEELPLAAGFLTGKFVNNEHAGTRFDRGNPLGNSLQKVLGAGELHAAMRTFDAAVKAQGFTSVEVAIRWLAYHSALTDGDGIILGASKAAQVSETVDLIQRGPLPSSVLSDVEELWVTLKETRGDIL